MKRLVVWLLVGVAALAVLAIVAVLALPRIVDMPRIQAYVASTASQALGRPVTFSSLSIAVLPLPAVELHDLRVAEDPRFGTEPFLTLDTGRIRLQLWPLLRGRVELGGVTLTKPVITVIQAPDGRLNVATLGAGAETEPKTGGRPGRPGAATGGAATVLASRVEIDEGVVTFVQRGRGEARTQYTLRDLDLTLVGRGTQVAVEGDARLDPGNVALTISDGLLALDGARSLGEAPVRATVAIDGRQVKDLVAAAAGPSPAIDGAVKGVLTVGGTVAAPTAAGDVTLSKLGVTQTNAACPEPRQRTLAVPSIQLNAAWRPARLTAKPLTATVADGTVTSQMTVSLDRGVRVQLSDLAVKGLALEPVLVEFLCQGYAVTGPLDLTGALAFEARDLLGTLSGPGQLRIGAGKVVGTQALALIANLVRVVGTLGALQAGDVPTRVTDSPLEFESITGTYQMTNGVVRTRDLRYTSRTLKAGVAGEYALPTGRMDLDLTVMTGKGDIKAKVTGTASSPSVRVSPTDLLRGVDPNTVERGLQDLLRRFR